MAPHHPGAGPLKPLVLALSVMLFGTAILPGAIAQPIASKVDGSAHEYDLPAAPLDMALGRFAAQAGVLLSADASLTRGKSAMPLKGNYSVTGGFEALLAPHGLQAVRDATGVFLLKPLPPPPSGSARRELNLPTVVVTARPDPAAAVYETPASVAVITREQMDRLPPRNTSDLLVDVPGVFTSQGRQDPGVSINLRGLQDFGRVNVMIDGARQNYQQSGHGSNGQVYVDPELLGGVDIAKGPVSTSGGAGMIAGMVNFRTLEFADLVHADRDFGGRVNATTGSNAYHFAGSAALAARIGDDIETVMAVSRKNVGEFKKGDRGSINDEVEKLTHGVSRLSAQDQTSGLLKLNWRLSPEQRFKLSYIGFDAKFDEGNATDAGGGATTTHNRVNSHTLIANHEWRPADSPWVDLASSLYYTSTRNQSRTEGNSLDSTNYQLQYQTSTVGGTLENRSRFTLSESNNLAAVFKTGGEFFHDWTNPKSQALTAGADAGTTALYTGSTPEGQRTVASLFGEANLLKGDWLDLNAGLRYDWYGLKGDGLMRVGSITNPAGVRPSTTTIYTRFKTDRHDGAFSPRLSLAIKPVEPVQFFANAGMGMRPPAITETLLWGQHVGALFPYYPNPNLQAERSRTWEIGSNLIFGDLLTRQDKLRLKAAWFNSRVKDYITLSRVMSPTSTGGSGVTGPYAYMNLNDSFRTKGLELSADYDAGFAFGNVNYTRTIIRTGSGGYDPFPLGSLTGYPDNSLGQPGDANIWYVLPPQRNVSVSGGLRLLERKLTLGARWRHQTPSVNTSIWMSDMYNQKSWNLVDLWASYDATKNVTLRLAVNNLRDKNYSELQGVTYFVGPGRTTTFTLSVKF